MAEYGAPFPTFFARSRETAHLTYVPEFADLDWHLGRLAVSIDGADVGREYLATIDPRDLADRGVTLQSGTDYVRASWPIDQLIAMYLAETSVESWTLVDEDARIEARGSRGAFRFARLSAGEYAFRVSVAEGHTLGEAAGRA